jgi:hypothetical protein
MYECNNYFTRDDKLMSPWASSDRFKFFQLADFSGPMGFYDQSIGLLEIESRQALRFISAAAA